MFVVLSIETTKYVNIYYNTYMYVYRALLDMAIVEEGTNMETEVRKKEDDVYRIQLRLLEIQLRLLEEEERKLRLEERYVEGVELEPIRRRLEYLPSKMSKLRLKMVCGIWKVQFQQFKHFFYSL